MMPKGAEGAARGADGATEATDGATEATEGCPTVPANAAAQRCPRPNAGKLRAAACCQAVCLRSAWLCECGNGGPVRRVSTKISPSPRTSVARSVCHQRCCRGHNPDDHGGCGGVRAWPPG